MVVSKIQDNLKLLSLSGVHYAGLFFVHTIIWTFQWFSGHPYYGSSVHLFTLTGYHSERKPNRLQNGTNKNSQIPFLSRCSRSCQECVKHVLTLKCEICSYTAFF